MNTISGADASENLLSQAFHVYHRDDHKLQLTKCETFPDCSGCKRPASGSVYRCEPCNLTLHTHCMFPKQNPKHDFYPNCTFEFLKELPDRCRTKGCQDCDKRCRACTKEADGYVYRFEAPGQQILLHPFCFDLPLTLPLIDGLQFVLSSKDGPLPKKCIVCNEKRLKGTVTGYKWWFYESTCANKYHCHAHCTTKMLLEAWKKANPSDNNNLVLKKLNASDNNNLVPKNLNLPIKSGLKSKKKSGSKFFKILKTLLTVLVSILIGDPTTFVASLIIGVITN